MSPDSYPEYPVFRGLQRPLEFMGLQGRYISWAAYTMGGAIAVFVVLYVIFGFLPALIGASSLLAIGGALIFSRQLRGLHSKKIGKGIFVYTMHHRL